MQPHLSMRKFPLMLALMMQAFIMQAQAMGFERLNQITDEVIVRLVPAPRTIGGGLGLLQDVMDQENEEATVGAMAVFVLESEWVTSAKTSLIFDFRERQRAAGANYLRAKASKAANAGGGRGAEEAPSPPAAVGEAEGGDEVGAGGTVA